MFPWIWLYAPQISWPLSGAVTEDISTEAFFRGIKPGAGVPAIEKQVFDEASYGKQLGWLTDVLVAAIDANTLPSAEAQASLVNLKALHAKIEEIKGEHREDRVEAAIALLDEIAADDPEALQRVLLRYQPGRDLLAAAPPRP